MSKITPSNAKMLINKDNGKSDLIAKGFHKLDEKHVNRNALKIKWGKVYLEFNDKEKIQYLQNLASTMNHAAYLIQEERNDLLKLYEKKEKMVEQARGDVDQNLTLLHSEISRMNQEKQEMMKSIADRNKEIKELKTNLKELETK